MAKITSMEQLQAELTIIRQEREKDFWPRTGDQWTGEVFFKQIETSGRVLILKSVTLPRIADVSANRQNGKFEMALEVDQAGRTNISWPLTDRILQTEPVEIISRDEAANLLLSIGNVSFYKPTIGSRLHQ